MKSPELSLALGGGGARGFAHIGVLQVLQEAGYTPARITGTSMGAIIGAMFAETLNAQEVEHRFHRFMETDTYWQTGIPRIVGRKNQEASFWNQMVSQIRGRLAINIAESRQSIIKRERLRDALGALLSARDFSDCRIPFTAMATDLHTGRNFPLRSGDLLTAVEASAAVPGFLPPVEYQGALLSDGGIGCPIPVDYLDNPEDSIVIAVGVPPGIHNKTPMDNAIDIINRAEQITTHYYSMTQARRADITILPSTEHIAWNEFHRIDEVLNAGRDAGSQMLKELEHHRFLRQPWWRKILITLGLADLEY